jgi:hypothetical protein
MSSEHLRKLAALGLTVALTLAGVVALLWFGIGLVPQARAASPIYVRPDGHDTLCNGTTNDPYPGSGGPGLDCAVRTIQNGIDLVDPGGTVNVAAGTYTENVSVSQNLTLQGAGASSTAVDGSGTGSVFSIGSGYTVTISSVTIRNGNYSWGGGVYIGNFSALTLTSSTVFSNTGTSGAGGIFHWGNTLTIDSSSFISNTAGGGGDGGAILNNGGALSMVNCTVTSNTADGVGGGIASWDGTLSVSNSTVSGNQATGTMSRGGGIFNDGSAVLTSVTVNRNTANDDGGGIHNQDPMTMTNVTISGNTAGYGGGLLHTDAYTLTIVNSTIASNTVTTGSAGPGGIQNYGIVTFRNAVLAHNQNANCSNADTMISNGHNLDSGATCGLSATGDITDTDPLLGPLQDNGGDTWTHALLQGSPAIDTGTNTGCPPTDQRGVSRPVDGDLDGTATCDIGAYEYEARTAYLPLVLRNF